jgi:large subunit ribosomal protein L29
VIKAIELRKKSADELGNELTALHTEQFKLRMQKASGEVPQTHLLRRVRRNIAKIKTILKEKEGS